MPEGHSVHRLAKQFTSVFTGERLAVSSPQGRFAGGAEQIDGATSPELLLAVWGQPGNDFVQPWRPAGERGA